MPRSLHLGRGHRPYADFWVRVVCAQLENNDYDIAITTTSMLRGSVGSLFKTEAGSPFLAAFSDVVGACSRVPYGCCTRLKTGTPHLGIFTYIMTYI